MQGRLCCQRNAAETSAACRGAGHAEGRTRRKGGHYRTHHSRPAASASTAGLWGPTGIALAATTGPAGGSDACWACRERTRQLGSGCVIMCHSSSSSFATSRVCDPNQGRGRTGKEYMATHPQACQAGDAGRLKVKALATHAAPSGANERAERAGRGVGHPDLPVFFGKRQKAYGAFKRWSAQPRPSPRHTSRREATMMMQIKATAGT